MSPTSLDEEEGAPPAIDPRIRARRIAVRRGEGRRRLRRSFLVVGVILGLCLFGAAVVGLIRSPLLDVDRVVVVGAANTGADAVVAAAGIEPGERLVTADIAAAVGAVEALPWVAEASVQRAWPGTVRIDVVERIPVAALARPGTAPVAASLVDAEGRVLAEVVPGATDVVAVEGLAATGAPGTLVDDDADGALALASALPRSLAPRTTRIVVDRDGALRLELSRLDEDGQVIADGQAIGVVLGDDTQLAAKLSAVVTVVASVDLADVAVIDLAVPSVPALTPR